MGGVELTMIHLHLPSFEAIPSTSNAASRSLTIPSSFSRIRSLPGGLVSRLRARRLEVAILEAVSFLLDAVELCFEESDLERVQYSAWE